MRQEDLAGQIIAHAFHDELTKIAGQEGAALGGAAFGPIGAAIGAEKGKGWRAAGGAFAGGAAGSLLGRLAGIPLGMLARTPEGAHLAVQALSAAGTLAGSGYGAYRLHGKDKEEK